MSKIFICDKCQERFNIIDDDCYDCMTVISTNGEKETINTYSTYCRKCQDIIESESND